MASAIMSLCLYGTAEALTVDTINDSNTAGDGECSLREAITAVNTPLMTPLECISVPPAPAVINFMLPNPSTITLLSALPALVNTVTITGPGAAILAVSGGNMFRVFDITSGTFTISDLTIRNGSSAAGAGLRFAFLSSGSITDSTISNNTGDGILSNATLSLNRSTISGNGVGGAGAGINALGIATQIVNSTISSNLGTGILVGAAAGLTMFSSTVTGNGGAGLSNNGMATVNNTIFSNHAAIGNCIGTPVTSLGYNLEDTEVCGFIIMGIMGDLSNTNPLLGPLQNNGGPTFTHALTAGVGGSPAIDAGDPNICGITLLVDQRGMMRPNSSGVCDIGAFEWHARAGGGGGGGCSSPAGKGAAFDPTLWLLVLVSCIYLGFRRPYAT